jgi:outer membrane murein-binding lipoprotein Lpp
MIDTKNDLESRGKKFFGIGTTELQEKKLAELNATVDHLTTVVVKLIEKRNAASPPVKPAQKEAVKATSKTTPKTRAAAAKKTTVKAKPKAATVKKTAAKKVEKPAAKASPKKSP